jgi:hypothetical protein
MSSRRIQLMIAAAFLFFTGQFWWERRAQAQSDSHGWEFATVEGLQEYWQGNVKISTANICYHTPSGCRWDTVRASVSRWGESYDGIAAATAQLGSRGWEAVGPTSPNEKYRPAILMKRPRFASSDAE